MNEKKKRSSMHLNLRYKDGTGHVKVMSFEQVRAVPVKWKAKNPQKAVLFKKENSMGECFDIIQYKDTGKIFLAVKGGHHESFWLLDEYSVKAIVKALIENPSKPFP